MGWKPDLCIYHGGCDDGFGAAWAVWRKWGNEVAYIPGNYGKPIPDVTSKHVLFVDFSLKKEEMREAGRKAASIIVLDHHKTAQAELFEWGGGEFIADLGAQLDDVETILARNLMQCGLPINAYFDMNSSGAAMAWAFCHELERNGAPPTFISYIEDRDLWRFAYGDDTRRFSAALRTYPHDFAVWNDLAERPSALIEEGVSILRGHQKIVEQVCEHAYEMKVGGHTIPVVNVPYHYASDCAHHLLITRPEAPFAAAWFQRGDCVRQFSLRSEDSRVDVSEIAKAYGGGGHRNAAGFGVPATAEPV